jgi:hypothetical protein
VTEVPPTALTLATEAVATELRKLPGKRDGSPQVAENIRRLAFDLAAAALDAAGAVTEHAIEMSGGGMHIRWDDPECERIYPLAQWIPAQRRHGGHVYRRRVVVVEDWEEVTEAP